MIIRKIVDDIEIIISNEAEYLKQIKETPYVLIMTEEEYEKNADHYLFAPYIYLADQNEMNELKDDIISDDYLQMVIARMNGLPLKIGANDRFFIRELSLQDCPLLVKLYENEKYIEKFFVNEDEADIFLENYIHDVYGFYGYGIWGIYDINDNMMGVVGFTPHDEDIELCYALFQENRSKNIAYEATVLAIKYAEKNIDYKNIIINTNRNNTSSVKLAKKLEKSFDSVVINFF